MIQKTFILLAFLCLPLTSYSQKSDELPNLDAYFSALIVEDMNTSLDWYRTSLGFTVLNKKEFPNAGFKQANLKRNGILIELIELDSAKSPKNLIKDYHSKTRIKGIFKIGFQVSEFDKWMQHLSKLKVEFHGRVVTNKESGKKMVIIKDPDGNRIQLFEK